MEIEIQKSNSINLAYKVRLLKLLASRLNLFRIGFILACLHTYEPPRCEGSNHEFITF